MLDNKVIVITGATGGLGEPISRHISSLGASVVLVDVNAKKLDSIGKDLNCFTYVLDLLCEEDIKNFVKNIQQKYTNIDGVINCAGITLPSDSESYPTEHWDKTFKINVTAPFLLCRELLPMMKVSGASIVNITSLNSEMAFPNNPAYVASKGALKQLTKSIALDYGKYNIRCNNVGPGYMMTDMTKKSWSNPEMYRERKNKTVLGRWGSAKDLIGIISFLLSDSSEYITGQDVYVDGGWLIKGL